MSLINQVLKDLDSRQPMQDKPVKTYTTDDESSAGKKTVWLRLLVWGCTTLLVGGYLAYSWWLSIEEQPVDFQPVTAQAVKAVVTPVPEKVVVENIEVVEPPVVIETVETVETAETVEQPQPVVEKTMEQEEPVAYLPLIIKEDTTSMPEPVSKVSVKPAKLAPLEQARAMITSGELSGAELQLRNLLQDKANDINARELLIGLLLRNQRNEEALAEIDMAKRFYPVRENLALLAAKIQLESGNTEQAVKLLEKQVAIKKAGEKTLAMLAPLYQQQKNFAGSVDIYEQLVSRDKGNGRYWSGLGISLDALSRPEQARMAYQKALQLDNLEFALKKYVMQRLSELEVKQ